MSTIPILDWRRFRQAEDRAGFVADLGQACRGTGFFLLTGHGIADALMRGGLRPLGRVLRPACGGQDAAVDPDQSA